MKHYPRIILFPVTTISVSGGVESSRCRTKQQEFSNTIEDKENYTSYELFIFRCCGSFSFNICAYIFHVCRSAAGMPGPRGASILRPKMSDIMPFPNLKQHYAPPLYLGEGEVLLSILRIAFMLYICQY